MKHTTALLLVLVTSLSYGQFKTVQDSLDYMENYGKYFDCKYEKGNVLIVRKKEKLSIRAKAGSLQKMASRCEWKALMIWNLLTESATEPVY